VHDWQEHLTTLFPEVRPRGYLELRCIDAIPPSCYAAPIVLVSGLLYDPASLVTVNDLLGSPNRDLLPVAAASGLGDAAIAGVARDLVSIGLAGARRLGEDRVAAEDLEAAADFFARYSLSGASPGDFTASER
jgi:glutamate--cysteine ligase